MPNIITGKKDFTIYTGSDFTGNKYQYRKADGTPASLAGYQAMMMMKVNPSSKEYIKLTSADGDLVIDSNNGIIELNIKRAIIDALPYHHYGYDLSIVDISGKAQYFLRGNITISKGYTKW